MSTDIIGLSKKFQTQLCEHNHADLQQAPFLQTVPKKKFCYESSCLD